MFCDTFRSNSVTGDTMRKKKGGAWQTQYNNGPTAEQLRAAFSPRDLHCTALAEMSEKKIRAIEREYGAKVMRPIAGRQQQRQA